MPTQHPQPLPTHPRGLLQNPHPLREWEVRGGRIKMEESRREDPEGQRDREVQTARKQEEEHIMEITQSTLGDAFSPRPQFPLRLIFLQFLFKSGSAVWSLHSMSSSEKMLPPPRTSDPRAPLFPICLSVPREAWGLDSLYSLWLEPLLEMGSRPKD